MDRDTILTAAKFIVHEGDVASQTKIVEGNLDEALYAGAHLPQTASVVAGLLQKSDRYTRIQLASDTAKKRAAREHKALIALANDGAIDSACDLLLQHIEAVRRDLLGLLQSG